MKFGCSKNEQSNKDYVRKNMKKSITNLSPRLETVVNMVTPGYKIADIGTDHGFVPISLIERNITPSAIAMDVNDGPLVIARDNIKEAGLIDKIEVRKSDGLENLKANEVDCAILAGMGGNLIMKLLADNWDITTSLKECILGPQSEWEKVRRFLLEYSFSIVQEDMVKDAGKYYLVMKVTPQESKESCSEVELAFGKLLLEHKNPVLLEYLRKEIAIKERILEQLKGETGEHIQSRKEEVLSEIELSNQGLEYY